MLHSLFKNSTANFRPWVLYILRAPSSIGTHLFWIKNWNLSVWPPLSGCINRDRCLNRRWISSILAVVEIQSRSYIDNAPVLGNFVFISCTRRVVSSLAFISVSNFNYKFLILEAVLEAFFRDIYSSPSYSTSFLRADFSSPDKKRLIHFLLTRCWAWHSNSSKLLLASIRTPKCYRCCSATISCCFNSTTCLCSILFSCCTLLSCSCSWKEATTSFSRFSNRTFIRLHSCVVIGGLWVSVVGYNSCRATTFLNRVLSPQIQ